MDKLPRNVAAGWLCFMVGVLAALAVLRWWAGRLYGDALDRE